MTLRVSTGLVNGLLASNSLKSLVEGASGFLIDVYSGSRPASPDLGATGTKLFTLSVGGVSNSGMHLAATAADGAITELNSETWQGYGMANGTAGYYRLRLVADDGQTDSSTAIRIDGTVATSGADMNLTSTVVAVGAPFIVSSASFSLPNI